MESKSITYRHQCRLCYHNSLKKVIHFEQIPNFDEVISKENLGKEFLAPIDIYWCESCNSMQSQHDVNIKEYYFDYQYIASNTPFIQNFMKKLAIWTFNRFKFKKGDKFIDIGSANGYQLFCFKELGGDVLGFEPAKNLCEISVQIGVPVVCNLFTGETIDLLPAGFSQVQCIVLLHTFDHLLDPVPFLQVVKKTIDPRRGVLILEVHDVSEIIERNETALFGHEHATFLHPLTMQRLLERNGLKILDINFIPEEERRGNTMLLAIGHESCVHEINPNINLEKYKKYDDWDIYINFQSNIYESFTKLKQYIINRKKEGKIIVGYGAWGRGSTTLSMGNLTSEDLLFIADQNEYLHNCYTPGSNIIIKSPNAIIEENVDEVIVFCYGYINEIRHNLKPHLDKGGKIISVIDLLKRN